MSEPIILTIPDDIANRAREIAGTTAQPVEQVLLDHLKILTISPPIMPPKQQTELEVLQYLSDDAL